MYRNIMHYINLQTSKTAHSIQSDSSRHNQVVLNRSIESLQTCNRKKVNTRAVLPEYISVEAGHRVVSLTIALLGCVGQETQVEGGTDPSSPISPTSTATGILSSWITGISIQ